MKRTPIILPIHAFPSELSRFLTGVSIMDSSCSREARVYYVERDRGYYLKCAAVGTLAREAEMTKYFHSLGLGAKVVGYWSEDKDYLLTERVLGEDCTYAAYLEDPMRLCDTTASILRMLHDLKPQNCPVADRNAEYLRLVEQNYETGCFDTGLSLGESMYATAKDAWRMVEQNRDRFVADTLLHGDYCLPNVMLCDWQFSGFVDVDHGGVGDRHIDLFWGAWTLCYNLKTDRYCARFLDAYGRDRVDVEMLRVVAAAECFG